MFNAMAVEEAFRYMQKGTHIGRIGISIRQSLEKSELEFVTKTPRFLEFSDSASYLLIGGLGGLGQAISVWMVEQNARELIYLSRGAGTKPGDEVFLNELRSMGCNVQVVTGDVTKTEDVEKAFSVATFPLKGIIQMSMVLRDQNFSQMTFEEWSIATHPKIQGSWNLHNAALANGANLDFFVLFSSLSGIVGQPGQANYASANTFLDAFTQYRRGLHLPASVIDIGAVVDVGFVSKNYGLMTKLTSSGFKGVTEQELLDAMVVAITAGQSSDTESDASVFEDGGTFVLGLGSTLPLNSPHNRAIWRKDRRMAAYHNNSGNTETASSNETLKTFLAMAKADPSVLKTEEATTLFATEIGKKLLDLLLKPQEDLNMSLSLVDLGLDSLVALELRAWWKQVFTFDISVLEMLSMGSLITLGQSAAETLYKTITQDGRDNDAQ
jgi:aryl carrier-like protein